jgi:hypothetical protein
LTVFIVVAVCGGALVGGADIIRIDILKSERRGSVGTAEQWDRGPGVWRLATEAADPALAQPKLGAGPAYVDQRMEYLTLLLAAKPLSSRNWLSLAELFLGASSPRERAVSALRMSYVTGPNEANAMFPRIILGLLEWSILPETIHRQTAHDLAGMIENASLSRQSGDVIKASLAGMPDEIKNQIFTMLRAEQLPAKSLFALGLGADSF